MVRRENDVNDSYKLVFISFHFLQIARTVPGSTAPFEKYFFLRELSREELVFERTVP